MLALAYSSEVYAYIYTNIFKAILSCFSIVGLGLESIIITSYLGLTIYTGKNWNNIRVFPHLKQLNCSTIDFSCPKYKTM